jgi:hypothetical protein
MPNYREEIGRISAQLLGWLFLALIVLAYGALVITCPLGLGVQIFLTVLGLAVAGAIWGNWEKLW